MLFATPSLINLQWYTKIFYNYRATKCIYHQRQKQLPSISIPTTLITTAAGRRRNGHPSYYYYPSSYYSSVLFTKNDSKQSTTDTTTIHGNSYHPSNNYFDDYDNNLLEDSSSSSSLQPSQLMDAHHWFTELLPEGWCVGVISGHDSPSLSSGMMMVDEAETTTTTTTTTTHVKTTSLPPNNYLLLHPDEHRWGIDHIPSESSRSSYYLGRMALRSSIGTLLDNNYNNINTIPSKRNSRELAKDDNSNNNNYYTQLQDQIRNMAINKDMHGRPILPNIISGSISHKEGYAVGLSNFCYSTITTTNPIINHHPPIHLDKRSNDVTTTLITWQEECPFIDDDNDRDGSLLSSNNNNNNNSPSSIDSVVHGVGIDLERIDGSRGKRIQQKVLTENEVHQLGGLEAIGISCDEEVILRFRYEEPH
jgi:hypothetical protein